MYCVDLDNNIIETKSYSINNGGMLKSEEYEGPWWFIDRSDAVKFSKQSEAVYMWHTDGCSKPRVVKYRGDRTNLYHTLEEATNAMRKPEG